MKLKIFSLILMFLIILSTHNLVYTDSVVLKNVVLEIFGDGSYNANITLELDIHNYTEYKLAGYANTTYYSLEISGTLKKTMNTKFNAEIDVYAYRQNMYKASIDFINRTKGFYAKTAYNYTLEINETGAIVTGLVNLYTNSRLEALKYNLSIIKLKILTNNTANVELRFKTINDLYFLTIMFNGVFLQYGLMSKIQTLLPRTIYDAVVNKYASMKSRIVLDGRNYSYRKVIVGRNMQPLVINNYYVLPVFRDYKTTFYFPVSPSNTLIETAIWKTEINEYMDGSIISLKGVYSNGLLGAKKFIDNMRGILKGNSTLRINSPDIVFGLGSVYSSSLTITAETNTSNLVLKWKTTETSTPTTSRGVDYSWILIGLTAGLIILLVGILHRYYRR